MKKLLILLHSDVAQRDYAGTLAYLRQHFDVETVTGYRSFWLREQLWQCATYIDMVRRFGGDREFYNRKRSYRYWTWSQALGFVIAKLRLPVLGLLKAILDLTRLYNGPECDLVLIPTPMRDLQAEDVIRWAKRKKIPSIALQMNWDSFNFNSLLVTPDFWGIWGSQGWYFARLIHKIPSERLKIIGSARLDPYFHMQMTEPPTTPKLFVAGVSGQFDEEQLLKDLSRLIQNGYLPSDLRLIYKPHPKKNPVVQHVFDKFEGVSWIRKNLLTWDEYAEILQSVDATITAYSTMGLESAICGKPVLCVGWGDTRYWNYVKGFPHVQAYRDAPWAICCDKPEDLIPSVKKLLTLKCDPEMTRHLVYRDERTFNQRLHTWINEVLA